MYGGPEAEGAWCVQRTKGGPRGWSQVHMEGLEREAGVTTGPRRPGVRVHFLYKVKSLSERQSPCVCYLNSMSLAAVGAGVRPAPPQL